MTPTLLRSAFVAAALLGAAPAAAQAFKPEKPVEIVVAATPGGGYDTLARALQRVIQDRKLIETPVVLIPRPGAGGAIGWMSLNQRPSDGHAISIISGTILGAQIMGQSKLRYTDFTTLPMVFNEYLGFHVRADSPIRDGRDLVERVKKDAQSITITPGTSIGTLPHVALALVFRTAGVGGDLRKLKVVAFNSTGESATAVAGGHVDVLASRPSNVAQLVAGGKLRTLAVSAPTRMPAVPNVPTWRELGVEVVYGNWFGLIGPAAMTAAQIAYWDDLVQRLTRSEEWKKELDRNQWTDFFMASAEARRFLDQQNVELRGILTDIGLAK